jgi:uncharacterized protein
VGIAETALIITALILMIIGLLLTLVPFVPGPILLWGVGMVTAILTGFDRVPLLAVLAMTGLMLVGSTAEIWMQFFGLRMEGSSCVSTLGGMIGGIVGTFMIPIPLVGTVIGMVLGALAFEFMRQGELELAIRAGQNAFQLYLLSVAAEFTASVGIFFVFALSVWVTR